MSLYRTYRPQAFSDVIGQDHIVTTLENAVAQDKATHAYLFAGMRGTGKTSVARILAKALLTRGMKDDTLQKQIEKGVEDGSLVDLIEIDAASNRGIDDIRDLVEKIQFSPAVAAAKVYIIDEVHMLTKEAFNALLKTLEEPPPYAFFILATTELTKIPATIQSRCQRFFFRQIREDDLIRRLQYVADQEKIDVDRAALRAIAHAAQGGMRDAISLLDQLRSLEHITVEAVAERIGATGQEHVEEVLRALAEHDAPALLNAVAKIEEEGIPFDAFLRSLLQALRTQLHAAIEEKAPIAHIARALDAIIEAVKDVRISPVPGLVVESTLLSLITDESAATPPPRKAPTAKLAAPPPTPIQQKPEARQEEEETPTESAVTVEAPEFTLANVIATWPQVVQEASPPSVKQSLKNGRVHAVTESNVTVNFTSTFHKDKVATAEASRKIEDTLERIFKRSLKIECVVDVNTPVHAKDAEEEMVNLAEAAAEVF
ncbi:MAG: DNA polymerase III subunit gamma/tau [Candidatus Peregrinibacteria bacterium]|nr:DNA polymerase III subunit gamma/tau [Candidatus Peregrinibacteria bacterium]